MQNDATPQNVIVVEGRGSVEVSPDVAALQVRLEVDADGAGEALGGVSDGAAAVLSAALAVGLEDEDVKTTSLNVFPQMDHSGLRVHHYRASYGVLIRLRDIARGPRLIESVSAAAGDALRLGGFHLTVSDPGANQVEAGARAVADARARADRLAEAAGVRLGRVLSIVESQGPLWGRPMMAVAAAPPPMSPQPPVQAGTEEIAVQVTVTFEIVG